MSREFFERDTAKVASDLLGKGLVHRNGQVTSGIIVETEAYYGKDDPASRASEKRTKVNEVMWNRGGVALVYMVHANWLFNITTEGREIPGAVLIRALDPRDGISRMKRRRGKTDIRDLASGPGKLTQALGISNDHHGLDLTDSDNLFVKDYGDYRGFDIETSHRIGVSEDMERDLRFFIKGGRHVS